jgi:ATP-dependent DNA helicase PIF1
MPVNLDAVPDLIQMASKNRTTANRWQQVKILLVDEVSMVDADFLDKLGEVAKAIRKNTSPFGGIQVKSIDLGSFMWRLSPITSAFKNG